MASLGKRSSLASPLGADPATSTGPDVGTFFRRIAASPPGGIHFANAGAEMHGIFPTEVGQVNNVSAPACTAGTMDPIDKNNMSGVIRKRGRRGNSNLPGSIKG